MRKYAILLLLFALTTCLVAGCNKNVKFGGKVTFDDGTPVTTGTVCFQKADYVARGTLDANGNYQLGGEKLNGGLPKGEYKVYLNATETIEELEMEKSGDGAITMQPIIPKNVPEGAQIMGSRMMVPAVAIQYTKASKTPLTCNVDGSQQSFDFQVERYQ